MADFELHWKGDEVARMTRENVAKALSEFALEVEGQAKRELRKGHGVLTATLKRSIHTALPGYDWRGDDVEPSANAPERGSNLVTPEAGAKQIRIQIGSGLVYAMAVHQGHHTFNGYHYLTFGLKKAQGKLTAILEKHGMKK